MLSVTPTKLTDYLSCPRKYKFKHVSKIGEHFNSAALSFGQSMHLALQEIHQADVKFDSNVKIDEVSDVLNRFWQTSAYVSPEIDESYFLKGSQALQNYCKSCVVEDEITIGTEVYMSYILKLSDFQVRIGCKADRICVNSDKALEIVDYKTTASGKVPTAEYLRRDLPTFLYYALARINYPEYERICISFLNVITLAKVTVEYNAEQIKANKKALFRCLESLDSQLFAPTPSEACSWCSFQNNCSAVSRIVDFASIT